MDTDPQEPKKSDNWGIFICAILSILIGAGALIGWYQKGYWISHRPEATHDGVEGFISSLVILGVGMYMLGQWLKWRKRNE